MIGVRIRGREQKGAEGSIPDSGAVPSDQPTAIEAFKHWKTDDLKEYLKELRKNLLTQGGKLRQERTAEENAAVINITQSQIDRVLAALAERGVK